MNKKFKIFILFSIIILGSLLFAKSSWAATYYVRTDGHDIASGLNDTNNATTGAWLTIKHAAATAECGATVIVGNGNYYETDDYGIPISKVCTAGNVLTIQAQNKWEAVTNNPARQWAISGNYITIDGFKSTSFVWSPSYSPMTITGNYITVTNCYMDTVKGIAIELGGTHNTASNNYIYKPQYGFTVNGSYNLVDGNEVVDLSYYVAGQDCDYARSQGHDHIYKNNNFHSANLTACEGGSPPAHVDCFQSFYEYEGQQASNILIEGNTCSGTHQGVNPSCTLGGCDGYIVRNNIFVGNSSYCIVSYGTANFKAYNNTCVSTDATCVASPGGCFGLICSTGSTCEFKNNIIVGIADGQIPIGLYDTGAWITDAATNETNNLLYSIYKTYNQATYPRSIVNQDPLFISSSDYHLQSGSPAKDAGVIVAGFSTDKEGIVRPQGSAWDIGAYEYTDTTSPVPPSGLVVQ